MKKIIAISALMAANALAADASLSFNGNVLSGTCVMNSADATKTLTIPDVSPATLAANPWGFQVYTASTTIGFTGCPTGLNNVVVAITSTTGTIIQNGPPTVTTPASGTATGIVLVLSSGASPMPMSVDGSNINKIAISSSGTTSVPLQVGVSPATKWLASAPAVTAGTYSSSYTLTFTYS